MPHAHFARWIDGACVRQVITTGLLLSVCALPAPAFAQSGLIGGIVGGIVNPGFQQQPPPQYYQPPPQQYYQPSTQQYPQPSPQNNQPQLQQTNQQLNDQIIRDDETAERLRQRRAAAAAAKKARSLSVSADKANPPADQKGQDGAAVASATPTPPSTTTQRDITAQSTATAQPSTTLPVFSDQTAYADARTRLIALGYGPSPSGNQHCDPAKDDSCYPERESCFGSNVIQCNFSWTLGDKVIRVQTVNLPPTVAKVECLNNCQ